MKFDQVFSIIGEFGKYQLLLCILLWVLAGWPSPAITIIYTLFELPHWCRVPGLEHLPHDQQKMLAVPWNEDDQQYDSCHRYNVDFINTTHNILNVTREDVVTRHNCTHEDIVRCQDWVFDHTDYGSTMVETFELVCDRAYLKSMVNTIFLLGFMVASVVSGFLSDRYGRKKTLFGMNLVSNTFWLAYIFSPNFLFLAVGRFLVAVGRLSSYISGFLLCMEILGPHWRSHATIIYNVSYAIGYMLTTGIAVVFKDSMYFDLTCVLPQFVFLMFWFIIPESPRWLLVNKKYGEAELVLRKIGKGNGKPLPKSVDCHTIEVQRDKEQSGTVLDIFRQPNLRKRTAILAYNWFSTNLLYYAITLNSKDLVPGNYYLNNFLLATVEIPGSLIGWMLCVYRRTGRRGASCITLIVPGVCGIITIPLVLYRLDTAVTTLTIVGKMFVTAAFNVMYMYTAELFPTEVRHVGFGVCSFVGRISGMAATFFGAQLVSIWNPLPYIIFGIMATSSGLLNLLLPETLDQPLCDTIAEAEVFGTEQPTKSDTLVTMATSESENTCLSNGEAAEKLNDENHVIAKRLDKI